MLWLGLKYRVLPAIMQVKVTGVNNSTPDAMGGFADIFKATCNGRAIALKRFRGTHKTDENTIRVGVALTLNNVSLIFLLALISRMHDLVEPLASIRPLSHRCGYGSVLKT